MTDLHTNPSAAAIEPGTDPDASRPAPRMAPPEGAARVVKGVVAVVLLAGAVSGTPLRRGAARNAVFLPVAPGRTVLDCWRSELERLALPAASLPLPVRVVVDRNCPSETRVAESGRLRLTVERDPSEFRGTGGLLCDLAAGYPDESRLLVAHGTRLVGPELGDAVAALMGVSADVAVGCLADGAPAGVMLVRCGCLRSLSGVGFIDLNEQALPLIAKEHAVRVVRLARALGPSLRTRDNYIQALRVWHRAAAADDSASSAHGAPDDDDLLEDWRPTFSLVEPGAQVHPSAVVHDSVVLAGAKVEADAVLVRSVIGPGGYVSQGRVVTDAVLPRDPME